MAEENKIKADDLSENKREQTKETELPTVNSEGERGGHGEDDCCSACGG